MFKKTKIALAIVGALMLTGCSSLSGLIDSGAEINDKALLAARLTQCRAASVGSILREFNTKELAAAWVTLCASNNEVAPILLNTEN